MEKDDEMIPIDLHLADFKQYLDANSRCILSAKFGNGKSYFINQFIEKYSDEYLFIPIYPVNYQVMDNKDIFELIKRDILIRLLSSDLIDVENINFSTAFLCYHFFVNNATDTILDILELIPDMNLYGIDIKVGNVIKKVRSIKERYDSWKNEIANTKSKMSDDYINRFNNLPGSIYEFDAISQLICDIISEYKNNNQNKKVVLIIEDLDRIDPAHIFRILNVFSAHFDRYNASASTQLIGSNNKFGLDKIISVCDIDNIQNIYAHVYGEKTDFLGYISKFSNSKAYRYSLQEYLKDYIINYLLRKDFVDYTNICDILSQKIVDSMNKKNSIEANLRIIKSRLLNASRSIKKDIKCYLEEPYRDKYVKTDSLFIYLLSLLKAFDLEFDVLKQDSTMKELFFMTGKYWFLATKFTDTLWFDFNHGILCISYKVREPLDNWGWEEGASFSVENNGNEFIDINMAYFSIEHNKLASKMYDCIDDIASYLAKNAVV